MILLNKLIDKQLISPPPFLKDNVHYEVLMGSVAYGVSDDTSDIDVYGFAIPPKHLLFPYHYGNVYSFGKKPDKFEQYQQHHIKDKEERKEYDITIYNIVKYFSLTMDGNPNMIDSLFVPQRCVLSCSRIGQMVRDKRDVFLSKKLFHKFAGYAYSQLNKAKNKQLVKWVGLCKKEGVDPKKGPEQFVSSMHKAYAEILYRDIKRCGSVSKRLESIEKHNVDVKFLYHTVRLLLETEQLLEEHDLDLEKNREILKSIRRGEWPLEKVQEFFDDHEKYLRELYEKSTLPYSPNEEAVKALLIHCLEEHYGSLDKFVNMEQVVVSDIQEASNILNRVLKKIDR